MDKETNLNSRCNLCGARKGDHGAEKSGCPTFNQNKQRFHSNQFFTPLSIEPGVIVTPIPSYSELVHRLKELTHEADYQVRFDFPAIGRLKQEVKASLDMLESIDPNINK